MRQLIYEPSHQDLCYLQIRLFSSLSQACQGDSTIKTLQNAAFKYRMQTDPTYCKNEVITLLFINRTLFGIVLKWGDNSRQERIIDLD